MLYLNDGKEAANCELVLYELTFGLCGLSVKTKIFQERGASKTIFHSIAQSQECYGTLLFSLFGFSWVLFVLVKEVLLGGHIPVFVRDVRMLQRLHLFVLFGQRGAQIFMG